MEDFVALVNELPTSYHLADYVRKRLVEDGFTEVFEKDEWGELPEKFFVVRNEKHILAFNVADYDYGVFVGANSSSFGLQIENKFFVNLGCEQCDVKFCGEGLWWSWIDRDLTIAGLVRVKNQGVKKVYLKKTACVIPSLAVHLRAGTGLKGKFEKSQFKPIFSLKEEGEECDTVVRLVAENLGCAKEDVEDFELYLIPADEAALIDLKKSTIVGYRLSSLVGSLVGLDGFLKAGKPASGLNCFASLCVGQSEGDGIQFFVSVLERLGVAPTFYDRSLLVSVQPLPQSGHTTATLKSTDVVCQMGVSHEYTIGDKLAAFTDKMELEIAAEKYDWHLAIAPKITAKTNLQSIQVGIAIGGIETVREKAAVAAVEGLRKAVYDAFTLLGENRACDCEEDVN